MEIKIPPFIFFVLVGLRRSLTFFFQLCQSKVFLDDEHFSYCAGYLGGSSMLRRMGKCQDKNDDVEVTVVAVLYVAAFVL